MTKLLFILLVFLLFSCDYSLEKRVERLERNISQLNIENNLGYYNNKLTPVFSSVVDGNSMLTAKQNPDNPFEYFNFVMKTFDENKNIQRIISSKKVTVIEYDNNIVQIELKDGVIQEFSEDGITTRMTRFDRYVTSLDSDHNFFKKFPFKP